MFKRLRKLFEIVKVNEKNSYASVQCIAPDKCMFRFTDMCDTCKKNIGAVETKSYYES